MATELSEPVAIPGPTLTHEQYAYTHIPAAQRVISSRLLGWLDGDEFVEYPASTETVEIAGADYDALVNTGSAPGRFWPEDVATKHREIQAR